MADKNPMDSGGTSWEAWGNHVLTTLEKLEHKVDRLEDKQNKQREQTLVDVTTLKTKAGVLGTVSGIIASFITSLLVGLLIWNLTHKKVDDEHPHPPIQPTAASVIPPREDPLAGFHITGGGDA